MKLRDPFCAVLALLALAIGSTAHAALFRAYLSTEGLDSNPCTLPAPCRLLPAALAAVSSGGEIWMLDSGNFNTTTVNINKSVNILAVPGAVGSFVANGVPALTVSAAGLAVSLRNVVVVPFSGSPTANGVNLSGTSVLTIDQSLFSGIQSSAVEVTAGSLRIFDTLFRGNTIAIRVTNGNDSSAFVDVANVKISDAICGICAGAVAAGNVLVSLADTVFGGGGKAMGASASAQGTVRMWVNRATIRGFATALDATAAVAGIATLDVSASSIVGNGTPYFISGAGAAIRTRGNNQFADNGSGTGTMTSVALQ